MGGGKLQVGVEGPSSICTGLTVGAAVSLGLTEGPTHPCFSLDNCILKLYDHSSLFYILLFYSLHYWPEMLAWA